MAIDQNGHDLIIEELAPGGSASESESKLASPVVYFWAYLGNENSSVVQIHQGDVLLSVNDVEVSAADTALVAKLVRGSPDTFVKIKLRRYIFGSVSQFARYNTCIKYQLF